MHECEQCGQVCDCDGEDTWLPQPESCECPCSYDDRDDESEVADLDEYEPGWCEHGLPEDVCPDCS